jgi:hypothetical protein
MTKEFLNSSSRTPRIRLLKTGEKKHDYILGDDIQILLMRLAWAVTCNETDNY